MGEPLRSEKLNKDTFAKFLQSFATCSSRGLDRIEMRQNQKGGEGRRNADL